MAEGCQDNTYINTTKHNSSTLKLKKTTDVFEEINFHLAWDT